MLPVSSVIMAAMEQLLAENRDDDPAAPPALPHEGIEFPKVDGKSWRSLRPGKVAWNHARVDPCP